LVTKEADARRGSFRGIVPSVYPPDRMRSIDSKPYASGFVACTPRLYRMTDAEHVASASR
jgi:hypothetical protein